MDEFKSDELEEKELLDQIAELDEQVIKLCFDDPRVAQLATEHGVSEPTANGTQLGVLASAVEAAVAKRGPPSSRLSEARKAVQP